MNNKFLNTSKFYKFMDKSSNYEVKDIKLAEQGKLNDNCKSRIVQSYFSEGALYFGKYVLLTAAVYSIYQNSL